MAPNTFNPATDITDLSGKVIFVSGGTAGLGQGAILSFAKHNPAHIFFSGRNVKAANNLLEKVKQSSPKVPVIFISCDHTSFASIQECAKAVKAQTKRLDILMCNAGVMALPPETTKDGYELQFGINHLSHALLIKLLLPILLSTADLPDSDVRIINMTSIAYQQAPKQGIEFSSLKTEQASLGMMIPGPKWSRYGQSKLAQMLYSQEVAKQYPQLTSVSVHPGIVMTGLFDNVSFMTKLPALISNAGKTIPVEQGPYNQLWAATADKAKLVNGEYYEPIGKIGVRTTKAAKDQKLAQRLWEWTQKELEGWY